MEFVEIAGLFASASRGEGLGTAFLGYIWQVATVIHGVHCFEDERVTQVVGGVDPQRDTEIIETKGNYIGELIIT